MDVKICDTLDTMFLLGQDTRVEHNYAQYDFERARLYTFIQFLIKTLMIWYHFLNLVYIKSRKLRQTQHSLLNLCM